MVARPQAATSPNSRSARVGFVLVFSHLLFGAPMGLISLARRTAPAMFTSPAPCVMTSAPGSRCDVYCSTAFTVCADRLEFALSINAAAPATTGVAMLVPFSRICPELLTSVGYVVAR